MKIPFSTYDLFGYLASGFILIIATDYAADAHWLLHREKVPAPEAIFWTLLAYVLGHIVANVSSFCIEHLFVRKYLVSPEVTLFEPNFKSRWRWIFPIFYQAFPEGTRNRIAAAAAQRNFQFTPNRAFFFHCHAIVKHDKSTLERLSSFLNLYGFCRNISMAALLTIPILIWGACHKANPFTFRPADIDWANWGAIEGSKLRWALAALLIAVGMLYRYLKFFKHYTVEVYQSYAELSHTAQGGSTTP